MKTFIWNTEYDVIAVVAETQELGKEILLASDYYYHNFCFGDMLSDVIKRDADIVIEENQCIIYDHVNE